ncbi:MAG: DUF1847 domain-containing protein, partial [Acidobacteriota bacterium]
DCAIYACRQGRIDAAPPECVMRGEFPDFESLYDNQRARSMAYHAARVEAAGYCRWTRLREVIEFARRVGFQRIGVAHCPDMRRIASRIQRILTRSSLDAVMPPQLQPSAQASFFAAHDTDLNIIAGMCVAHEVSLIMQSDAPIVCLVARDERLHHNPAAALYASHSYLHDELFGAHPAAASSDVGGGHPRRSATDFDEAAARVRRRAGGRRSRLREAMAVAHQVGARHIGVSYCVGFREEASRLCRILEANGFRVSSVCCKSGAVPKERFGLLDREKVRPGNPEMACNPIAQGRLLNRERVDLTLILGQCVGHDAATLAELTGPAVTLVAKDRVLAHNTVAALD